MDRKYWLHRSSVASMMARKATSAEARLIHYELAGRYSAKASLGAAGASRSKDVVRHSGPGPASEMGEDDARALRAAEWLA